MAAAQSSDTLALPVGVRAIITRYGQSQDDAIENCLELEPQAPPLRSELLDNDIVLAVKAAEVVWTDTVMATGQYQHQPRLPFTPGVTFSGIVVWAGPKAVENGVLEGQRVAIAGMGVGPRSSGRYQKWGGCQSYAVAPVSAVRPVPAHWDFNQAACFAYGYDTAYHGLVECGKLAGGETVLIHGATGGVGTPAVRIAKLLGATVIATTRSEGKSSFLKSIGVDHVLCIGDGNGKVRRFREDVKALTGGKGVDVVYDGVGGDDITVESMHCCRFRARFLIMGWAATPNVAQAGGNRGVPKSNRMPTNYIMMKGLQVIGCPAAISTQFDPEGSMQKRRIEDLSRWLGDGSLPPPAISSVFPLDSVRDALKARVRSGQEVGATIVRPPDLPFPGAESKL